MLKILRVATAGAVLVALPFTENSDRLALAVTTVALFISSGEGSPRASGRDNEGTPPKGDAAQ